MEALDRRGIVVSHREVNVRVAPHSYNVPADLDALLAAREERQPLLVESGSTG